MSEQDTGARTSPWTRVQASERSRMHRQLAKSVGEPTDERARQVWDEMSEAHRRWARQAAWEGQVADHPHHALVVGDLQGALLRRRHALRWLRLVAAALFVLVFIVPEVVAAATGDGVDWSRIVPVLFFVVAYVLVRRGVRRRVDARLANLVRASEELP